MKKKTAKKDLVRVSCRDMADVGGSDWVNGWKLGGEELGLERCSVRLSSVGLWLSR